MTVEQDASSPALLRSSPPALWWRRLPRPRFIPLVPGLILAGAILVALFADRIATHDAFTQDLLNSAQTPTFAGGTTGYLLGTDTLGRDIFSRVVFGTRISLTVAALVIGISATAGSALGILAGYFGGKVDMLVMRVVDITLALPLVLVAIVVAVTMGASLQNLIIVIAAIIWARFARQVRAETLSLREQDYVTLARIAGISNLRIMFRHILPGALPLIIVITSVEVGQVILTESALSFLGVGVPPPTPSWGGMVSEGRAQLYDMWWVSLFPGLAIVLVVLSLNLTGDWLRDYLDPRMKRIAD